MYTLTYKLTEQDLLDFNTFHTAGKLLVNCISGSFTGGLVIALLLFITVNDILASVITGIVIFGILFVIMWKPSKNHFRRKITNFVQANDSAFLNDERTVRFTDEGVYESTSLNDSLYRWNAVSSITLTAKHLFLFITPAVLDLKYDGSGFAVIIPRSMVTTEILELLRNRLKMATGP